SNGSCTPSQSTVTITVDNNPLSPNAGIDQLICTSTTTLSATAATGGSWSLVSGSGNIVSANTAITSVTGMTAGVNVFRWTIPGGSCGSVSDDVSIVVQNPPSTANAGSDQTICSSTTTLAASTPAVGNGTWTVVSGFATFSNANSPTSDVSGLNSGTTVLRWTITNGVCTSTSDDVSIFVTSAPATPSAGLDQTICSSTTSLSASPSGGIWTLSSGSGTIVNASSATTSVTGLTTGTSVFRWTIDGGTCPDVWDEVSITIQALPTTSAAGQDQTICSTSATLSANAPSIGSGQWSLISGSGTFANASLPNSTISGLGTGTNVLRWTISNGVCQASTDDVTITVDANPVTPSAGIDQTICSSSTQLSASPAGGTWTLVSGTGTFQNATSPTTQVSGLSTGVNILRWTVSNGSCADASDDVSITVQAAPTVSNAGVDQQVCATSTTLSGNIPTVGSGVWTVVSGTATFVNATSANTAVSGLSAGVNVLRWTISNGVCSSSVDEVTITVDSNPVSAFAGNDQSICSSTATLAATVATGGLWTLVSGSGTIVSATSANSSVTGLIVGTSVFRWTVSSGTCPAVSDEVSINVLNPPTTANAGSDQTICLSATTLAANTPSSGNGVWTVVSGSGFFANATQPNSNVSGLSTGVNILRWSISNGVCSPSTDEVSITVLQAPSNVQAGSDQIICGSSATLSASAPSQGSGHWTVVSGSGVFSNSNSETSGVTGISAGQNVFRWTVTNGSCASASDEVSVQSFAQPTTANAGSDQTICTNSTTLQGNFATIGTGTWTLISGSGVILNTSTPQTQVSNLTVGTHVFRWSISNGVCSPSTDEVTIQVLAPLVSDAGSDQDVCSSSSTFQATLPSGATGLWTLISGAGIIQTPTAANSQISNLGIGANVFQWSVNNGVCPVATSTVTINRFADPSAANAGIDFQTCANSANLAATTPSIGTGFWSVVTGSGTFSNPTLSNSAVTGLSAGINKLEWAISNGPCSIKRDTVIVTVDQNPTNAFAGSDQQLCTANSSFSATPASSGTGSWTVISGSGTIANANLATSAVTNLGAGANVFRWTVVSGTCTTFDEVILTRFLPPTTAVAGTNLIICSSSATLNANAPTIGTGLWTVLSGSGTFAQASNAGTTISNLGIGANVLSWTISNGVCPASVDQVTIDRQESPTTANAGLDQQICSDQIQLSGNVPTVGNGVWSLVSGTGTLENALSPTCVVSGLGAGANVFQWSTLNGLCPASTDQVTITRDLAPSQADAGNDTSTCLTSIQLQAINPSIGTGVWSIVSGSGSLGNATSAQTNLTSLNPGITEVLWSVSNGVCPSTSESIQITVYAAPQTAFAGIDEVICSDSIFLVGNTSNGSSYLWEVISGSAVLADDTAAQTALTSIAAGNSLIRYTITNGPCSSSDSVAILRYENPDLANAGLDSTFCSDVFVNQATQPLIGQGHWFSFDPNVSFSDSSAANTSVNLPAGISTLVWIVENGICPALSDTIVLQRDVPTELASAMSDTNVCAANLNIFAQSPTQAIGYWELISGDGVFIDSTVAQTELGMSAEGENVIVWTLEEGSCLSSDTVTIAFNYAPFPVSAGADRSVCGLTTDLEGVSSGIGSGLWTFLNSDGTLSDPSDPIAFLTVDYTATRELIWTVTNGFCAVSDTVTLDFLDQPISDAGLDLIGCLNDTTALQAAIPSLGIGTWTVLTPGGNVFEPGFQNSNFTATEQGNFYLQWTVVNGICRDSSFTIVTIYGPDDPECSGPDVVFIPEGFSPNGDGVLDKLIIVKPQTKRVSLEVFDRYGILVYSSNDYQNDWDGTAQAGTILHGNQLPESTYYYLIQIEGELGVRKGYITLWR
ncbi:MAG TPA: gliding motility-associated C-terminal domain-containing protein, partial [Flavobacteriales bacterium]|nr:gliding motility-associated C-terminal domain-containing protein [Flavobacteriales bacterium]